MENAEFESTADRAPSIDSSKTDEYGGHGGHVPFPDHHPTEIGAYRIEGLLGGGGMGRVYLARQSNPDRQVAIKVMSPGRISDRGMRRFEFEADILGRLKHPCIAQVHEAGAAPGPDGTTQPYFAMEYVDGSNLLDYMNEAGLDLRRKLLLIAEVADAVEHAHRRGVIHRDLKPGNILVDRDGRPKILDFGVARIAATDRDATEFGAIVGTLAYMSPEQASGDPNAVDTRSDVYSLGAVLYQALSGALPIDLAGKTTLEAIRSIVESKVVPLNVRDGSIPSDVAAIAAKSVAADKEVRYASAAEFAADIRRFLANEPILARKPSTWYTIKKYVQRKKAQSAALAFGIMAAIASLTIVSISLWKVQAARLEEDKQRGVAEAESARGRLGEARRLMQRADWRGSLRLLETVDPAHLEEPSEKELLTARALLDGGRLDESAQALKSLDDKPLGIREAQKLLIRAEVDLNRSGADDATTKALRRALSLGTLDAADAAYAEGLLADATAAAVEKFRKAVDLDPFHHGARAALVFLLLISGEQMEAVRAGEIGRAFFPEDPRFVLALSSAAALTGDRKRATTILEEAKPRLNEADFLTLAETVQIVADVQALLSKGNRPLFVPEVAITARRFDAFVRRLQRPDRSSRLQSVWRLPCIRRAFGWLSGDAFLALSPHMKSNLEKAKLAAALAESEKLHPEGMTAALEGMILLPPEARSSHEAFHQCDAACERLERAVRSRTCMPVAMRSCKLLAMRRLWDLGIIARDGSCPPRYDRAKLRTRLRNLAEHCIRTEKFDAEFWNLAALCADLGEDHLLCRRITEEWSAREPGDMMARFRVISADIKLGNFSHAFRLLEEVEPQLRGTFLERTAKNLRAEVEVNLQALNARINSRGKDK
jgi:serine/threonine protein kinase